MNGKFIITQNYTKINIVLLLRIFKKIQKLFKIFNLKHGFKRQRIKREVDARFCLTDELHLVTWNLK